jgi:hypothetical protein
MSTHWEGFTKMAMHKGRADGKAGKGGHALFGKSGGGAAGVTTKMFSTPMTAKMAPPKLASAAGGKSKQTARKGY